MSTDPVRLLSKGDDPLATSLLKAARDVDAETARARKAAMLGATGGAVGAAAVTAAKLAPRGFFAASFGKWVGIGAVAIVGGAAVATATYWSASTTPEAPSVVASEKAAPTVADPQNTVATLESEVEAPPVAAASPAPADSAAPAAPNSAAALAAPADSAAPANAVAHASQNDVSPRSTAAAVASPTGAATPRVATASPTTEPAPAVAASDPAGLSEEVAAIRSARDALNAGRASTCLTAVDAYFARFPKGRLSAEARFLKAQALLASGRGAEAAAVAKGMLAGNPNSPYAARLRTIAGEDDTTKDR
ncbi:MAG: hypothetical protein IPK82_41880 [Polyangiaceae bacterium]|nr:hypothetical protein [Polyangiaceae bacterium]